MDINDSGNDLLDIIEEEFKDHPLLRMKKRKIVLWYKTFFLILLSCISLLKTKQEN